MTPVRIAKVKEKIRSLREIKIEGVSVASYPNPTYTRLAVNVLIHYFTCRSHNKKAARAQFQMMPIGTPRVPYRTPGEGTWQWVDLWNALVSEKSKYVILCNLVLCPRICNCSD